MEDETEEGCGGCGGCIAVVCFIVFFVLVLTGSWELITFLILYCIEIYVSLRIYTKWKEGLKEEDIIRARYKNLTGRDLTEIFGQVMLMIIWIGLFIPNILICMILFPNKG